MRIGGKKVRVKKVAFFWDRQQITTSTTSLNYFQEGKSSSKTIEQTNLVLNGKLPEGYNLLLLSPRAEVQTTLLDDLADILNGSVYTLKVNDKPLMEIPLSQIPAGGGPAGVSAITGTNNLAGSNGAPSFIAALNLDVRNAIKLLGKYTIPSELQIPTALSGLSASTNVRMIYFGILYSPLTVS